MQFPVSPIVPLIPWWAIKEYGELPKTEQDKTDYFVFSPFGTVVGNEIEMMFALLFATKLAKTPEGLKVLRDIVIQYLKTVGGIVEELEASSSSNWLTAVVNQKLCSRVLSRIGLLTPLGAAGYEASLNEIFRVMSAKAAITETLSSLGSFFRGYRPPTAFMYQKP